MKINKRSHARALCAQYEQQGKPLEWFDVLYRESAGDSSIIPWADMAANAYLCEWHQRTGYSFAGKRCLVVGCGLGDDAEFLAAQGGVVIGFDIAATAIEWCRRRFPNTSVDYRAADLFATSADWERSFEFVLEAYTLPALAPHLLSEAMRRIAGFLAPSGTLLVISRGREPSDPPGLLPRPITRDDLQIFSAAGLQQTEFEDFYDQEKPPVRRFRVRYTRN